MKVGFIVGAFAKHEVNTIKNIVNTLNMSIDDLTLIDLNKSDKVGNLFEDSIKVKKLDLNVCKDWDEAEEKVKDAFKNLDAIFVTRFPLMNGFKRDDISSLVNFLENRCSDPTYGFKFILMKSVYQRFLILDCISMLNISLFHIVIDPDEPSYDQFFYFKKYYKLFILKRHDTKYAPYYEYYLKKYAEESSQKEKKYEVFFRGVIVSPARYFLYDMYEYFKDKPGIDFGICDKGKFKKCKLSQGEYYDRLNESKYTIIVKAYDEKSFSMIRFMEAICYNCIPLILDDVCLFELSQTFPDIYEIAKKLVVSQEEVVERIKNYDNDYKLLQEIKESKSFQKITNSKKVKEFYNKLLGVNNNG